MSDKVPVAHRIAELAKRIKELSEQLVSKVTKEVASNGNTGEDKETSK
jgi:hypothetical protein